MILPVFELQVKKYGAEPPQKVIFLPFILILDKNACFQTLLWYILP